MDGNLATGTRADRSAVIPDLFFCLSLHLYVSLFIWLYAFVSPFFHISCFFPLVCHPSFPSCHSLSSSSSVSLPRCPPSLVSFYSSLSIYLTLYQENIVEFRTLRASARRRVYCLNITLPRCVQLDIVVLVDELCSRKTAIFLSRH